MRIGRFGLVLVASLATFVSAACAANKSPDLADVYFGYSRAGANLYAANTPAMNGWQLAAHIKPMPFVGVEADFSRYSQSGTGFSQDVSLFMVGPRVTVGAGGISVFAHGLGGFAHEHGTVTIYPPVFYTGTSYAFGGGADLPVLRGLKVRVTADYLGNSKAPPANGIADGSVSHFRMGVGLAYHF